MKKTIVSARIDKMIYEFDTWDIKQALIQKYGFPVGWTQEWEFAEDGAKVILVRTTDEETRQETL